MKKESTKETLSFVKDVMSDEDYLDSVPNTINNPLKLRWDESTFQYKVNKSGDRSGLYVDLNVAKKLKEEKEMLIEAVDDAKTIIYNLQNGLEHRRGIELQAKFDELLNSIK